MAERLPLEGVTLCGYCLHPLVLQTAGDWACDRCRDGLAAVTNVVSFAAFQRAAAKRRPR